MKYFVDYLPITTGNELRLYIDGEGYGRDLFADIAAAKEFVFLTGLHFMGDYRLVRTGKHWSDRMSSVENMLSDIAGRGVAVYLLVNQFWKDEQEVNVGSAPLRHKIMKDGELRGYLPETFKLFEALGSYKNAYCRTDIHAHSDVFATHHQKTVVIDDRIAYLGGIDLTFLDGDRWDTPAHKTPSLASSERATDRTQKYWHDVHMRVEGPAVELVRDNFIQRWTYGHLQTLQEQSVSLPMVSVKVKAIVGVPDPNPPKLPDFSKRSSATFNYPEDDETADVSTVQIVRSMPRPVTEPYDHKRGLQLPFKPNPHYKTQKPRWNKSNGEWEHSAKDAYLIGIRAAKQYIYLENQWVADEDIWAELAAAARRNKNNRDFRIILMVPYEGLFAAGMGSNQELFIGAEMVEVMEAGYGKEVFGMYALSPDRDKQGVVKGQIYVHSKVLIVDDEWALIGSANAGGISLEGVRSGRDQPDTELSAIILDKTFAATFRQRLWEEHLGQSVKATYDVGEADLFRVHAAKRGKRVVYFPGYEKIKKAYPTWSLVTPASRSYSPDRFTASSRIVPAFPLRLDQGLPVTLVRAAFKVQIVPAIPPGWRAWYRWACDVHYVPGNITGDGRDRYGRRLKMRSLKNDKDEVWQYSDQDAAYIGEKSARWINAETKDVTRGRIICRVQFVPSDQGPVSNDFAQSMLLQKEVDFMNDEYALINHPDFAVQERYGGNFWKRVK